MKPLIVTTRGQQGKASLTVYADSMLFRAPSNGVQPVTSRSVRSNVLYDLMGMSLIGPEQAIRAIGAGCALKEVSARVMLGFAGEDGRDVLARWTWKWRVLRAMQLAEGAVHLVAVADQRAIVKVLANETERIIGYEIVIVPADNSAEALETAIYDTLGTSFSTPLIPCDREGQPEWERAAGEAWRSEITTAILRDSSMWNPLMPHPSQPDNQWANVGVLSVTDVKLDALVSMLLRRRTIQIPEPPKRSTKAAPVKAVAAKEVA